MKRFGSNALIVLLLMLIGCGKIPGQSNKVNKVSTFADDKVQIQQNGIASTQKGSQYLESSASLQVIINNSCLDQQYARNFDGNFGNGISINYSKRMSIPIQSYLVHLRNDISLNEVDQFANNNPCIIGISDNIRINVPRNERIESQLTAQSTSLIQYNHLQFMNANQAKARYFSSIMNQGRPIRISIIDSGIDFSHPDLNRIRHSSENFSSASSDRDVNGHGTHVAGLAASMLDFNPAAVRLINAKALDDDGGGAISSIFNAVIYSVQQGADIINMSLSADSNLTYPIFHEALAYAARNNVLVVVASGNENKVVGSLFDPNPLTGPWPSALATIDGILNVGSIDIDSQSKSTFSNYGANVEIWSAGCKNSSTRPYQGLNSARVGGGYIDYCGTSMASPIVAGAAGLAIKHFISKSEPIATSILEEIMKDSVSTNGILDLNFLVSILRENDMPNTGNFDESDNYGQFISDIYKTFLARPHLTSDAENLLEKFRLQKRSFEWLAHEVLQKHPRINNLKSCNNFYGTFFNAFTNNIGTEKASEFCSYMNISNSLSLDEFVDIVLMSNDFLENLEQIDLLEHPIVEADNGKSLNIQDFHLRRSLSGITNEILRKPATSSDLKYLESANSLSQIRRNIYESHEYYVMNLYEEILDRNINNLYIQDREGWQFWTMQLEMGNTNREAVREAFNGSFEKWLRDVYRIHCYRAPYNFEIERYSSALSNGLKTEAQVIQEVSNLRPSEPVESPRLNRSEIEARISSIFYNELDRQPTSSERYIFTNRVENKSTRILQVAEIENIKNQIHNGDEARIVRSFKEILSRGPSQQERSDFLEYINNGLLWGEIRALIREIHLSSNDELSAAETISDLYWRILNREPDEAGLNFWVTQYFAGLNFAAIENYLRNSAEAQIRALYLRHLQREPDEQGLNFWLGHAENGMSIFTIKNYIRKSRECLVECL